MYLVDASTGKVVIRPYTLNKSRVPEEYQKYKVTGTDHQEVAGNTVKTGTVDPTRFFTENQTGLKF